MVRANVSAMIMFAAARYNAHCLLSINPRASEHREPAVDQLQQEFRAMLEENIDWLSEARQEISSKPALMNLNQPSGRRSHLRLAIQMAINPICASFIEQAGAISAPLLHTNQVLALSLNSLYSKLSTSAFKLASTIFSCTPVVPHTSRVS